MSRVSSNKTCADVSFGNNFELNTWKETETIEELPIVFNITCCVRSRNVFIPKWFADEYDLKITRIEYRYEYTVAVPSEIQKFRNRDLKTLSYRTFRSTFFRIVRHVYIYICRVWLRTPCARTTPWTYRVNSAADAFCSVRRARVVSADAETVWSPSLDDAHS